MKLTINKVIQLPEIASASGIEIINDQIYIIGDDSLFMYQIDTEGNIIMRYPLSGSRNDERISKALKPDYEAMTRIDLNGESHLLIVGSGSVSGIREKGILYNLTDHRYKEISLETFYTKIKVGLDLEETEVFNIEGLCSIGEDLLFAQRGGITGNQFLFRVNSEDFFAFCSNDKPDINIKQYRFKLPEINKIHYGISGCTNINNEELLFCASAENTDNTYDDGPILGSLIGYIKLSETAVTTIKYEHLNNLPADTRYKLESLSILSQNNKSNFSILSVSDNDDGSSILLDIDLKIYP